MRQKQLHSVKRQFSLSERANNELEFLFGQHVALTYSEIVCEAILEKADKLRNPPISKYAALTKDELQLLFGGKTE